MSASSDLHIETMNLASDWTALVGEILSQPHVGRAMPQKPDDPPSDEEEWRLYQFAPDLAFIPTGATEKTAIEIKMLRWRSNWLGRVSDAVAFMEQVLAHGGMGRGVIVLSIAIAPELLTELNAGTGGRVEIWDLEKLRDLASADSALAEALEDLAAETDLEGHISQPPVRPTDAMRGAEIAARLRATSPGRPGWQAFESACYEAIRHLFGRELHNLLTQHRTDDGLNRMDLIGRIRSGQQSFWAMIASDFSTRYIVFDAKNYVAPIDQDAVHTTAKYLMHRALRTFAIIIARDGASPQAMQVAAGGLREDGKFVLVISMADVCSMLEGDDRGDPPENRLFEKLDEVLMSLGR